MFECTLIQGELFRKLIASVQDLVQDGNFMCDANGISLQGMDSSHVALVALVLKKEGFEEYRCDRDVTLGINFASLGKILKCMGTKDRLSIRAQDEGDSALFVFESEDSSRISNFELKLMQIDQEQLGVPETKYKAAIRMPSSEFQRICKDLSAIGDTVSISATKEAVKFSVGGDIGSGDMSLRQSETGDVDGDESEKVMIDLEEPVQQNFALRYLNNFTKATALSKTVTLSLGADMPLVTEYKMDNLGSVRYYLAPKIDDEE
jgi:proliferating cell nuclear antigen